MQWTYNYPVLAEFLKDNPDGYDPHGQDAIQLLEDLLEDAILEAKYKAEDGTINLLEREGRQWALLDQCVSFAAERAERYSADASPLLVLMREDNPDVAMLKRAAVVVERLRTWEGIWQARDAGEPEEDRAELPLTDTQKTVLNIITSHPEGIQGKAILQEAEKLGYPITQSTLTRHIIPALKSRGVENRAGAGYYINQTI